MEQAGGGGHVLALGREGSASEERIIRRANGRKVLLKGGQGENSDGGAVPSVNTTIVDGGSILGAETDFQGNGFGGARNLRGKSGVDLRFAEVFAEHFGLRFDVLRESDAGAEGFFHGTDAGGESVFYILLNAKT